MPASVCAGVGGCTCQLHMYVCMYVCMYRMYRMYIRTYVRTSVCLYVCTVHYVLCFRYFFVILFGRMCVITFVNGSC